MTIYSNLMSVRGKNHTAFQETGKREQRVGKSLNSFIYFLIFRNLSRNRYNNNNNISTSLDKK
mgnify:CR=1 FL=1